jgi:hypothetical protein
MLTVMSIFCGCEKIEAPACAMRERERAREINERGGERVCEEEGGET